MKLLAPCEGVMLHMGFMVRQAATCYSYSYMYMVLILII